MLATNPTLKTQKWHWLWKANCHIQILCSFMILMIYSIFKTSHASTLKYTYPCKVYTNSQLYCPKQELIVHLNTGTAFYDMRILCDLNKNSVCSLLLSNSIALKILVWLTWPLILDFKSRRRTVQKEFKTPQQKTIMINHCRYSFKIA